MIKVDEKCIHCGLCIQDCIGRNVLEFDENKVPFEKNPDNCIKCQHCLAICPVGALSFKGKNPKDSAEIIKHDDKNLLNLIQSRRSIRQYKKENVPSEIMSKLKNMLKWTPTGVNNHNLHFSFVDDINVMNDFRNSIYDCLKKLLESKDNIPDVIKRYEKWILQGDDLIFRGAPHMVVVSSPIDAPCVEIDPVIALSYFELYAQSLGVGTCWCGIATWILEALEEFQKRLQIPKTHKLSYTMLFGIPDVKYKRCTQPDEINIISVK